MAADAFSELADSYDDTFTDTSIGRVMRSAVWERLGASFVNGDRILELNCGTGVDASWLGTRGVEVIATDAAPGMVEVARARGVDAHVCRAEDIDGFADSHGPFDGALSNFGGLNCVDDLGVVAAGLGRAVRPGGVALLCVMGPVVPWEWAWYLLHGKPTAAFRRLRASTEWRGMTIRYPSARSTRRTFAPWFDVRRTWALGALVPPSYVEPFAAKHPRLLARLDRWERRVEQWRPIVGIADHYVIELVRR
jgi:SAM-dependent methyltransferase